MNYGDSICCHRSSRAQIMVGSRMCPSMTDRAIQQNILRACCLLRLSRHVATAGQQARDRNILVNLFPVKADTAELDVLALRRCRTQEARKPSEGHADRAAV